MKEFFLDKHSSVCEDRITKQDFCSSFCELNPERFLFFIKNEYYLVTYHRCLNHPHIDFKEDIIKKIIEISKVYETYKVNRSVRVDDDLKDFIRHNKTLKKYAQEVNYLYSNASGLQYAITTKVNYIEHICSDFERMKTYKEAEDFLTKNDFEWLIPSLVQLHRANNLYEYDESVRVRTVDALIKMIKEEIKTQEK